MPTVVITGAAHGIGAALARRFAAGSYDVVLADLDGPALASVAAEVEAAGQSALVVVGDAATAAGVTGLIDAAVARFGRIDVFCANAGIDRGLGLEASEADWAASLEVNLMAHVRAAQLLVPRWLETGGGRFIVTASAAGLLTMLTAPAYSASKHAAVAFAEWLRATYGHRGIVVQALCPQGVRTRMLADAGPVAEVLGRERVLAPAEVADAVSEALADDRFLILPHPEVADYYRSRAADTDAWLAGMGRLQQKVETHLAGPAPESDT